MRWVQSEQRGQEKEKEGDKFHARFACAMTYFFLSAVILFICQSISPKPYNYFRIKLLSIKANFRSKKKRKKWQRQMCVYCIRYIGEWVALAKIGATRNLNQWLNLCKNINDRLNFYFLSVGRKSISYFFQSEKQKISQKSMI